MDAEFLFGVVDVEFRVARRYAGQLGDLAQRLTFDREIQALALAVRQRDTIGKIPDGKILARSRMELASYGV